jgi:K+-sensing histidine kinase KdpD
VPGVKSKLQQDITPVSDADPLFGPAASEVLRYLASIAMTAAATLIAVGVDSKVTIPNLSLVFVVPVIIAGVSLGLGPSLCSAILGALAFNFFLTEPRYTLAVDDPANVWAIGLLFVVGLIVSGVAFTSRQRATEAALLRRQAKCCKATAVTSSRQTIRRRSSQSPLRLLQRCSRFLWS